MRALSPEIETSFPAISASDASLLAKGFTGGGFDLVAVRPIHDEIGHQPDPEADRGADAGRFRRAGRRAISGKAELVPARCWLLPIHSRQRCAAPSRSKSGAIGS